MSQMADDSQHPGSQLPDYKKFTIRRRASLKPIRQWLAYVAVIGLLFAANRLSVPALQRVGRGLGTLAYFLSKRDREICHMQLQMAFPELEPQTRLRIARDCLRHQGMTLMETMVLPRLRLRGAMKEDFVKIENDQVLVDAHGKGKGVILVTAHLGNWELLPIALQKLRIKGVAMASTLNNERLNRIIRDIRRFEFMDVAERGSGDSPRQLLTCLKRGEVLIMVNDVDIKANGVFCNMFGFPAHTPRGAASIALKQGTPLVTYFDERLADGTHVIRFREIPVTTTILAANSPVQAYTQAICDVTEEHIRIHPEQWIWNHRRWKRRPEPKENKTA